MSIDYDARLDHLYRAFDDYLQLVRDVEKTVSNYTSVICGSDRGARNRRFGAPTRKRLCKAAWGAAELANFLAALCRDVEDELTEVEALRIKFDEVTGELVLDTVGGPVDLTTEIAIAQHRERERWAQVGR